MPFLQFFNIYPVHADTFIGTTNIENFENYIGLTPNQKGLYPNPLKPLLNLYKPFSTFKMCKKCDFYAKIEFFAFVRGFLMISGMFGGFINIIRSFYNINSLIKNKNEDQCISLSNPSFG